nr:DUF6055 domain-containing protein [Prolixibacteraceae bacterium]
GITVDDTLVIEYTDDPAWRSALTLVVVNGEPLNVDDFRLSENALVLFPSNGNPALTQRGLKDVAVWAAGYETTAVQQEIRSGAVNAGQSFVDPGVKVFRPSTTPIPVYARDSWGNPVANYAFGYDVMLVNANPATREVFSINGISVSASSLNNAMKPTDENGRALLQLTVPPVVDINDGLRIQFKLVNSDATIGEASGYVHRENEKEVYVPKAIRNLSEFKWGQTRQSENFTVFWGDLAGPNPTSFDPDAILAGLEYYYHFYIDSMKFVTNPDTGNIAKYKFVVILFNTWNNGYKDNGAYGGSVDDVIGAMWMNPQTGFVVAHEFGHACQAMIPIQYPGKGFKNRDDNHQVGMYWEACANYMAFLSTGQTGNMITPLFLNTSMLQYLSTIDSRQYESVYLPAYIIDQFGLEALGFQWRAADKGDNPFDALMKGLDMTRDEMRREAGRWAMHNVTWDYSCGNMIRSYLGGLEASALCREFTHLETIEGLPGMYIVPREMAPADYGYNIIPVYPRDGANEIEAQLTGIENEPAGGGGWSYGFVAVDKNGQPRYGAVSLETDEKASLSIETGDSLFYLVVLACPPVTHTYAWTPSWPLVYRFPYMLSFTGADPEGFHTPGEISTGGAKHSNGGGWVASTAQVAASVYVGPNARVLGSARVSDQARVEDFATIQDNAVLSGHARVCNNALVGKSARISGNARVEKSARVWGGQMTDEAVLTGNAVTFNCKLSGRAVIRDVAWLSGVTLSGYTIVGGDKTSFVSCSEGNYLSLSQTSCSKELWNFKLDDVNQPVDYYSFPWGDIPLPPENLSAKPIDGTRIQLNWDTSPDDKGISHYIAFVNGKPHQRLFGLTDTLENLKPETNYTISLIARDGTGNFSLKSAETEVRTPVSLAETNTAEFAMKIQPNPATGRFSLETNTDRPVQLTISNLLGDVVYRCGFSRSIVLEKNEVGPNGVYFARIDRDGTSFVQKFIIR